MVEHNIALDIIVYTPEEFETMRRDEYGYFVRDEILEKGKVMYEANWLDKSRWNRFKIG